jgi:hypothetical protein
MSRRDNRGTYERRNARARADGWTGYGQMRYWRSRWSEATVRRLAARCCHGDHELERAGSLLCRECNEKVNPIDRPREGKWQARLVKAAMNS